MLPKQCDICQDKIGLYQPYYTVTTRGYHTGDGWRKQNGVYCPRCFYAYKDFLEGRKTGEIQRKNLDEVKKIMWDK